MLLDFKQIKQGPQLLSSIQQLRTDLDNLPIDYVQTVNVSGTFASVTLSRTPTTDLVTMVVNNLVYIENQDFTVNRSTKVLTWTVTDLTITEAVATSIKIRFKTLDRTDTPAAPSGGPANVYGMILTQEGGGGGTWVRVDRNFNTVAFDASTHGTWSGMKTVTLDSDDVVVEIPTTYVKTEVINDSTSVYNGKTCWWTADGPVEGFHVHPAFMKTDNTPGTLRIGAYLASKGENNVPMSVDAGDVYDYWMGIAHNSLRSTALTKAGWRAYSIYDHHFLVRLMLTEFGTPDIHSLSGWDGNSRVTYHGIHDPFGWENSELGIRFDGLTTENGVWNVLAPDGSGTTVVTSDSASIDNSNRYVLNCRVDKVDGIDFGDLFIGSSFVADKESSTFISSQYLTSGRSFSATWSKYSNGMFELNRNVPTDPYSADLGWRIAQVV